MTSLMRFLCYACAFSQGELFFTVFRTFFDVFLTKPALACIATDGPTPERVTVPPPATRSAIVEDQGPSAIPTGTCGINIKSLPPQTEDAQGLTGGVAADSAEIP